MVANRQQEDRVPPAQASIAEDELDLFSYIQVLVKYRWTMLLVCFLAMATSGTISFLWPPSYVAKASIVPPIELSGGKTGLSSLLGGSEGALLRSMMDTTSVADLYVGILESRTVVDAIIDRFDLVHVYDVNESRYETEKALRKRTRIDASEEGIVTITVEDRDPNRAAAVANAYVEELDKQNKKLSVGQATSKRVFLENRLKEVEQKLSRIESIPTREAQIQEMLYELLMRELELARIEEAKSMPTIQVLDVAQPPERHKPKGTVSKALLAGIVSFLCVVFFAFSRDYCTRCRQREQGCLRTAEPAGIQAAVKAADAG
ncbi:MAG TPA: Wzz/FepE/Etk N-terminal domain-containing protein [Sedimentisphaerales bacterium]|jgi:uncharacterized protein involved in exopolysaccharide biosynthesis|nr:Wzz/FepE/Etk N-terminal domain-containing protein [Sedimentisphaerales bacterium]HNU27718.1 Wzz/FepE/Etk N-terminal domain-containing protein [Sedimentisphaerales bacterium]